MNCFTPNKKQLFLYEMAKDIQRYLLGELSSRHGEIIFIDFNEKLGLITLREVAIIKARYDNKQGFYFQVIKKTKTKVAQNFICANPRCRANILEIVKPWCKDWMHKQSKRKKKDRRHKKSARINYSSRR